MGSKVTKSIGLFPYRRCLPECFCSGSGAHGAGLPFLVTALSLGKARALGQREVSGVFLITVMGGELGELVV